MTNIYPIDTANTLLYIAEFNDGDTGPFSYTPPVGGFVLNTEAEYNTVVWTDGVYNQPAWVDILGNSDAAHLWKIQNDVYTNWFTTKGQASAAEPATTAASTYCSQSLTVNSHALNANITLTADDIGDGTTNKAYTATEKTKLSGLSTQVQSDWNASSGPGVVLNKPGIPKVYFGTTLKTTPIFYTASATVGSGVAVFQLTADGTSTGTALFPNGPNMDSLNAFVSDATASFQMSYALTNGNKTLTITVNKLTTANILSGILGQAAANGSVVRAQVWGS